MEIKRWTLSLILKQLSHKTNKICVCGSTAQSCLTVWPHGLQHTSLPCPSQSPGVCSNSCPLSQWCHLTISCSVSPFSSCPKSFPASGSFPVSSHQVAKVLELQLQGQPSSSEYSGLICVGEESLFFLLRFYVHWLVPCKLDWQKTD